MVRVVWRTAATILWTGLALGASLGTLVGPHRLRRRARWAQRWFRGLLRLWGVRPVSEGDPPPATAPGIVVSNHLSYLDVCVLGSTVPCVFAAKAEIRRWPFIGFLARYAGTVFVQRGNALTIRRQVEALRSRTQAGLWVVFFPEGRISDQDGLLPFRRGLFALAQSTQLPVYPVVLRYTPLADVHWATGEALHRHAWRWFRRPFVTVHIRWLPPVRLEVLPGAIAHLRATMQKAYEALKAQEVSSTPSG
jgi:1-acyl-sn-glycerol-3-phosphate acyltransferase